MYIKKRLRKIRQMKPTSELKKTDPKKKELQHRLIGLLACSVIRSLVQ